MTAKEFFEINKGKKVKIKKEVLIANFSPSWVEKLIEQVARVSDYSLTSDTIFINGNTAFNQVGHWWYPHNLEIVEDVKVIDTARFPHKCRACGSPAYLGFTEVECSTAGCKG